MNIQLSTFRTHTPGLPQGILIAVNSRCLHLQEGAHTALPETELTGESVSSLGEAVGEEGVDTMVLP